MTNPTPPFEATVIMKADKIYATLFPTNGEKPIPVSSTHPLWDKIWDAIQKQDPKALQYASLAEAVANKFIRISERVTTKWGKLFFDGDEVNNTLADKIIEFVGTDTNDYEPWVKFLENVMTNPQEHSRKQLYSFLDRNGYVLTPRGTFIGYKGVNRVANPKDGDKLYASTSTGRALVNGDSVTGNILQSPGDLVEMPRSECDNKPNVACSTGLHIANYSYAKGYGNTVVAVEVNPRDVVSVPTDGGGDKVRCCRYTLLGVVSAPINGPVADPTTLIVTK